MNYDLEWRPFPKDKRYWISNNGDVMSCAKSNFIIMKQQASGRCGDYLRVEIAGKAYITHRLVYETFVKGIPTGMFINHLDCDKKNNNINNLEVCTHKENMEHAAANGRMPIGSNNKASSIVEGDVYKIIELYKSGLTMREVSRKMAIGKLVVSRVLRGKNWTHITKGLIEGLDFKIPKRLKEDEVIIIKTKLKDGVTFKEICNHHNITKYTIKRIYKKETWSDTAIS